MKKELLFGLFAWLSLTVAAQQDGYRIASDDYSGMQVEFVTPALQMYQGALCGQSFTFVGMEGYEPSARPGAPDLPTFSRLIEVPLCAGFDVKVDGAEYDTLTLEGAQVAPCQPSRSKSDTTAPVLHMDKTLYAADAFYGVDEVTVEAVGVARDRRLARLQFSPVRYNPVSRQLIVCRRATVTVTYRGADIEGTKQMFARYHTPAFASGTMVINSIYPKSVSTTAPVRYLIVANPMFRGQLDEFITWKRRKGFLTDIIYTDDPVVGNTSATIADYIKKQYRDASVENPAPTYLLLVGDVEQLPSFDGTTADPDEYHVTDLYYATWTDGDHIPDCYYGRFSAQNISQLTPQIEKTLMHEKYTFADPSFLDRAVLVAGIDHNYGFGNSHADPAMDYAAIHYINGSRGFSQVHYFKNDTNSVPAAQGITIHANNTDALAAEIRNKINQGTCWANYSAHGGSTGWAEPNFGNSHVSQMTNNQKFGVMVGNCCQTNKFNESTCFGEALLRKDNYCGAVGYIGGSNNTLWGEDFYWAVGVRSQISATMSLAYDAQHLGAYDHFCHTHGEAYSEWATTQGALLMQGDLAVESSTSAASTKFYYWEIYHLMGDPSLMPYLTQPAVMPLTVPQNIVFGTTTSLEVTAVPYAYVALTDTLNHTLLASGFADANGHLTLQLPTLLPFVGYEVAASAQQYRTAIQPVAVQRPAGAFPEVVSFTLDTLLSAGDTTSARIVVANHGDMDAQEVEVRLLSNTPMLSFPVSSFLVPSIAAGETFDTVVNIAVNMRVVDQSEALVSINTSWSTSSTATESRYEVLLNAPVLTVDFSERTLNIMPGSESTLTLTVANNGHAPLKDALFTATSHSGNLNVVALDNTSFTVNPGTSVSRSFTLSVPASVAQGLFSQMQVQLANNTVIYDTTLQVLSGVAYCETFEGNRFHIDGWAQGTYPWQIVEGEAGEGRYSLRSKSGLTHQQTSEISITRTSGRIGDSLVFYVKVSSERNYDKFTLLMDTTILLTLSGEVDWQRQSFPVPAGTHTFHFRYEKDQSVSNGSDCAWIDMVMMPDMLSPDPGRYPYEVRTNETFEENSFHLTGWSQGAKPWFITATESYEGYYSLRSASGMEDNETSEITLSCNVNHAGDSLIFYVKVSSEQGYDKFFFYLDGTERCSASGNLQWTRVVLPLSAGNHTLKFRYKKDGSRSSGSDCAWIDLISLPSTQVTPVGIDPAVEVEPMVVYPNPTVGEVMLSREVAEVAVYDLSGRLLMQRQRTRTVDLSAFPTGTYLLRCDGTVHRVVKR